MNPTTPVHSRFELLVFDWDGTLVNSAPAIVASMQDTITALDLPPRSDHHIADMIGLDIRDGLSRLYPQLDPDALSQQLTEHRHESPHTPETAPLFDGIPETLNTLHLKGFRLAVATGRQRRSLNAELATHTEIAALFERTRCADEARAKPHPAMLIQLLAESGVAAENALMIGDTEYDIDMARGANVAALGVACGSHDSARLRTAGALAVLASVSAVPNWLAGRSAMA